MKITGIILTLLPKSNKSYQKNDVGVIKKLLMTIYLIIIFGLLLIPLYIFKKMFGIDTLKLKKKYRSTFSVIDKQYSQNDFINRN